MANTPRNAHVAENADRSRPIGVFLSGQSYLDAAQHLHRAYEAGELRLRFEMPLYYLYCHAIELILKAFLRAKGMSAQRLASREFGHNLIVLWNACAAEGVQSHPVADAFLEQVIELLDPFAQDFEFRYLKTGIKRLPTLAEVQSAVVHLSGAVEPHCVATLREPAPERG